MRVGLSLLLLAGGLSACAKRSQCDSLLNNIERVRSGEAEELRSHKMTFEAEPTLKYGGAVGQIDLDGDFHAALSTEAVHQCLGPSWRGRVENVLRGEWTAPSIVFERPGWPDVVLLTDRPGRREQSAQILIVADRDAVPVSSPRAETR